MKTTTKQLFMQSALSVFNKMSAIENKRGSIEQAILAKFNGIKDLKVEVEIDVDGTPCRLDLYFDTLSCDKKEVESFVAKLI